MSIINFFQKFAELRKTLRIITLKQELPLILFHLVFAILVFANFKPGTFFIGWDALNPELNFSINFERAFQGFWQENYGLGLLGGHGFSATLPHTLVNYLMSFAIPQSAIRYGFTFLCLYLGGLGMYFLVRSVILATQSEAWRRPGSDSGHIRSRSAQEPVRRQARMTIPSAGFVPLISSLFYMLNLGTIQIFYVQLEAFIVQFATLPWLFYLIFLLLEKKTPKRVFFFFLVTFFSTVQGFIPSLTIAYGSALAVFLIIYILHQEDRLNATKKSAFIVITTLLIHSYYLFPVTYFQVTRANIFLNSYNNLISTQHFIDINKKYGDFQSVALLKSYLLDNYELGHFMLEPWINHNGIIVTAIGYMLFLVSIVGLIYSLFFQKSWVLKAFAGMYIFFFVNLATNMFPISYIIEFLQFISPTFQQAFRTTFTKFGIGLAFSYSIFLGVGVMFVLKKFQEYSEKYPGIGSRFVRLETDIQKTDRPKSDNRQPRTDNRNFSVVLCGALLVSALLSLLFYSLPAFRGYLFFKQAEVIIPQPYKEIISYFKDQPNGRIADFPQDCNEGWYAYNWGYFGSGFYWYGIKQPILARTFDVWSNNNENYYWELSQALREENYQKVDAILEKYQARWVLYDPNSIYCRNQKGFLLNEGLIQYIQRSPKYRLVKTFAGGGIIPISLFVRTADTSTSYISIMSNIPTIQPRSIWSDNDYGYYMYGLYKTPKSSDFDVYYPFRSLFTKRKNDEVDFSIKDEGDSFSLGSPLPFPLQGKTLNIQSYSSLEKSLPVRVMFHSVSPNRYQAVALLEFPDIFIGSTRLSEENPEISLGEFSISDIRSAEVLVNGIEVQKKAQDFYEYDSTFYFTLQNKVEITDGSSLLLSWNDTTDPLFQQSVSKKLSVTFPSNTEGPLRVVIPKAQASSESYEQLGGFDLVTPHACNEAVPSKRNNFEIAHDDSGDYVRLISNDSDQCIIMHVPDVLTSFGYILQVKARNIAGNKPKLYVLNKERFLVSPTFIQSAQDMKSFFYLLPPTFQNEAGMDVYFENISENNISVVNDFGGITLWHVPYEYVKTFHFETHPIQPARTYTDTIHVEHPNETRYNVTLSKTPTQNSTLVLSQGFDAGWKAYEIQSSKLKVQSFLNNIFPFIFGKELKNHVLVNNWENGWSLDNNETRTVNSELVIIYLPQYLQLIGWGILIITLLYPLLSVVRHKKYE